MIGAVADRWDATIRTFEDEPDLLHEIAQFIRDVMRRKGSGELPQLSDTEQ